MFFFSWKLQRATKNPKKKGSEIGKQELKKSSVGIGVGSVLRVFPRQRMGKSLIFVFATVLIVISAIWTADASSEYGSSVGWLDNGGSLAELLAAGSEGDEEFELDSEVNRRILQARRYISYGALRRNSIPCSRRGASYYNCRRGGAANPYSRGCSAITRCRR